jgi:hypothetical protein
MIVVLLASIAVYGQPPGADLRVRNVTGDNTSRVSGIGDIVTRGSWIDVRAYGAAQSASAATNTAAIQAALDYSFTMGNS